MATYNAPIEDMKFIMQHIANYNQIGNLPGYEDASWDLVEAVLEEANKVANGVISPLNWPGDVEGAKYNDGQVTTPKGWKEAFDEVAEGGWIGLACDPEYGGQGLPLTVGSAVSEMWEGASISFALCNLLTQGALDALELSGSQDQKDLYMGPMIEGRWTGTMNLTEPQAGSNLAEIRTKAIPQGEHYRITGQKIFITYGEHDLTENIIHLVLGRLPDAPAGVKGISMFLVPKFMVNEDGSLGDRNDVHCISIEHKLGIHASPTAVLSFGDNEGAIGYLVGEANHGLEYMFIMMNRARFEMGIQAIGLADMAYQAARDYALERVQGKPFGEDEGSPIIGHPNVRRMLMEMKTRTEAMRALAYFTAGEMDRNVKETDEAAKEEAHKNVEFLIPIVKGWCTETGLEMTSLAIQVHGGIGFVEETGVAQYYRDARIMTIYEGTTGIQANDLIFRKVLRDKGEVAKSFASEIRALDEKLSDDVFTSLRSSMSTGADLLEKITDWIVEHKSDAKECAAASYNYLRMCGIVIAGLQMTKAAIAAKAELDGETANKAFMEAKLATANFYATQIMPEAQSFANKIDNGTEAIFGLTNDQF